MMRLLYYNFFLSLNGPNSIPNPLTNAIILETTIYPDKDLNKETDVQVQYLGRFVFGLNQDTEHKDRGEQADAPTWTPLSYNASGHIGITAKQMVQEEAKMVKDFAKMTGQKGVVDELASTPKPTYMNLASSFGQIPSGLIEIKAKGALKLLRPGFINSVLSSGPWATTGPDLQILTFSDEKTHWLQFLRDSDSSKDRDKKFSKFSTTGNFPGESSWALLRGDGKAKVRWARCPTIKADASRVVELRLGGDEGFWFGGNGKVDYSKAGSVGTGLGGGGPGAFMQMGGGQTGSGGGNGVWSSSSGSSQGSGGQTQYNGGSGGSYGSGSGSGSYSQSQPQSQYSYGPSVPSSQDSYSYGSSSPAQSPGPPKNQNDEKGFGSFSLPDGPGPANRGLSSEQRRKLYHNSYGDSPKGGPKAIPLQYPHTGTVITSNSTKLRHLRHLSKSDSVDQQSSFFEQYSNESATKVLTLTHHIRPRTWHFVAIFCGVEIASPRIDVKLHLQNILPGSDFSGSSFLAAGAKPVPDAKGKPITFSGHGLSELSYEQLPLPRLYLFSFILEFLILFFVVGSGYLNICQGARSYSEVFLKVGDLLLCCWLAKKIFGDAKNNYSADPNGNLPAETPGQTPTQPTSNNVPVSQQPTSHSRQEKDPSPSDFLSFPITALILSLTSSALYLSHFLHLSHTGRANIFLEYAGFLTNQCSLALVWAALWFLATGAVAFDLHFASARFQELRPKIYAWIFFLFLLGLSLCEYSWTFWNLTSRGSSARGIMTRNTGGGNKWAPLRGFDIGATSSSSQMYTSFFGLCVWALNFYFFLWLLRTTGDVHGGQSWNQAQARWFLKFLQLSGVWFACEFVLPLGLSFFGARWQVSQWIVSLELLGDCVAFTVVFYLYKTYDVKFLGNRFYVPPAARMRGGVSENAGQSGMPQLPTPPAIPPRDPNNPNGIGMAGSLSGPGQNKMASGYGIQLGALPPGPVMGSLPGGETHYVLSDMGSSSQVNMDQQHQGPATVVGSSAYQPPMSVPEAQPTPRKPGKSDDIRRKKGTSAGSQGVYMSVGGGGQGQDDSGLGGPSSNSNAIEMIDNTVDASGLAESNSSKKDGNSDSDPYGVSYKGMGMGGGGGKE